MEIAKRLEAHPKIDRVWYPGLESHPDHAIAKRQMSGFGGVVSFEVGSRSVGTHSPHIWPPQPSPHLQRRRPWNLEIGHFVHLSRLSAHMTIFVPLSCCPQHTACGVCTLYPVP